jgi:hypothetical protein
VSAMLSLLCPHQSAHRFMNMPPSPSPTANPELLRKLAQEFQPNPHRVPFRNLEPFRDSIETLRIKGASYAVIADLLRQHGVKTSRARVAEYGRIVLDKQKPRKRRRRTNPAPPGNTSGYTSSAALAAPTDQSAEFISILLPEPARPAHCQSQDDRRHDDLTLEGRLGSKAVLSKRLR